MKKLFITVFLSGLFSLISCIAQAQTCPQIQFSYDASGNRVQRKLELVPCKSINPLPDSAETAPLLIATVYPNPAQDKINIELQKVESETESAIFLYDLSGKEIYSTKTSSLHVQVDVSLLSAGNYLLKIVRGKEKATYTILKN